MIRDEGSMQEKENEDVFIFWTCSNFSFPVPLRWFHFLDLFGGGSPRKGAREGAGRFELLLLTEAPGLLAPP